LACYGRARMRIGSVDIGPGALLAPMEAVTDLPFRTICEELGAALTYTEFLSAEALTRGAEKTLTRMSKSLNGRKFAVQVFGRDPTVVARAAALAADIGASVLDINMGCPAKKVTGGMCGSALMREPEIARAMVAAVRAAIPDAIPVTVKHRAGWDDLSLNAADFARQLVDVGAALITVHGRTRAQGFSGVVRLSAIRGVREALPPAIPVVGNGDIRTIDDYLAMKRETGCDAVMIGRAARGNPWLFRDVRALEEGRPLPPAPTIADQHATWRHHAELVREYSPPKMLLHELRKTLAWYSRGLFGGADLRGRCFSEPNPESVLALGERFFETLRVREAHADVAAEPMAPEEKWRERHLRRTGEKEETRNVCEN
jgi:tRNA-dihydrouridine synthase B